MTRMCWPFSELGVVEKTSMIKVPSAIAGIKKAKKDIEDHWIRWTLGIE